MAGYSLPKNSYAKIRILWPDGTRSQYETRKDVPVTLDALRKVIGYAMKDIEAAEAGK